MYCPAVPPGAAVVVKTFGAPVPVTVTFEMNFGGAAALAYVTVPLIEGVPALVGVGVGVSVAVAVGVEVLVEVAVAVFVGVNVDVEVGVGVLVDVAVGVGRHGPGKIWPRISPPGNVLE